MTAIGSEHEALANDTKRLIESTGPNRATDAASGDESAETPPESSLITAVTTRSASTSYEVSRERLLVCAKISNLPIGNQSGKVL